MTTNRPPGAPNARRLQSKPKPKRPGDQPAHRPGMSHDTMSTKPRRLIGLTRSILADLRVVVMIMQGTAEAQWERSCRPVHDEDVRVWNRNEIADPVADTVADARRLRLRQARKNAERRLGRAASELAGARAELERARDRWESWW